MIEDNYFSPRSRTERLLDWARFSPIELTFDGGTCTISDSPVQGNYYIFGMGEANQTQSLRKLVEVSGEGVIIAKGFRRNTTISQDEYERTLIEEGIALRDMERRGGCVPHVIGFGITPEGSPIMLLSDMGGKNSEEILHEHIQSSGKPLPLAIVSRIAEPIFETLELAHENHRVFRDVKPSNIHIASDGRVVLLDWETQYRMGAPRSNLSGNEGYTPGYTPPEFFYLTNLSDEQTDVYATGATLTHLVSGYALSNEFPASTVIESYIQAQYPQLAKVLLQAVDFNLDRRYKTIHDFRQALQATELYADETMPYPGSFNYKELVIEQLHKLLETMKAQDSLQVKPEL